jgi:hypothetical protein
MTEPTDPRLPDDLGLDAAPDPASDALDALASAHLDGRTTEAEAARIAADPELRARVEAMEAVRAALRAVPPVSDAQRTHAISAALAALDDVGGLEPGAATAPTSIASHRARRAPSRRRLQLLGAAAAVAVVALLVPLLGSLDSDDRPDDLATSALDEAAGGSGSERDANLDSTAGATADAAAPEAALSPGDLGTFADLEALTSAVQDLAARQAATPAPVTTAAGVGGDAPASLSCADEANPRFSSATPVVTAGAVLDGRPVTVTVYEADDGTQRLVVVDLADCAVVADTPLPR